MRQWLKHSAAGADNAGTSCQKARFEATVAVFRRECGAETFCGPFLIYVVCLLSTGTEDWGS